MAACCPPEEPQRCLPNPCAADPGVAAATSDAFSAGGAWAEVAARLPLLVECAERGQVPRSSGAWEKDFSTYTGVGGVGVALLRVADFCGDEAAAAAAGIPPADAAALRADCLQKARRAAQVCLAGQPPNAQYGVSFFLGTPGHLALAAVVAHHRGDPAAVEKHVGQLLARGWVDAALAHKDDELLYGRAGYLYALLWVKASLGPACPRPAAEFDAVLREVAEATVRNGVARDGVKKGSSRWPLLYLCFGEPYLGAAHGTVGILAMLFHCHHLLSAQSQQLLSETLAKLTGYRHASGNLPTAVGDRADEKVHWCHGVASLPSMLHTAATAVGDANGSLLKAAQESCDVVWERGLILKGAGLCHGVCGNAYAFLSLRQFPGADGADGAEALARARCFAQLLKHPALLEATASAEDPQREAQGVPDSPRSLMEGEAGVVCFLLDAAAPERREAGFPGWDLPAAEPARSSAGTPADERAATAAARAAEAAANRQAEEDAAELAAVNAQIEALRVVRVRDLAGLPGFAYLSEPDQMDLDRAAADHETARAAAELADVRAEMIAVRAAVPDRSVEQQQQQCGLGDIEEVEVLLNICRFLGARALGRLACVSRCFGEKLEWPAESEGPEPRAGQPPVWRRRQASPDTPLPRSVVEESARRWLIQCGEHKRGWLPRENAVGLMRKVMLRRGVKFSRSHEHVMVSEDGSHAWIYTGSAMTHDFSDLSSWERNRTHCCTAASKVVMRGGRHYAQFTVEGCSHCGVLFGVIRPGWDVEGATNAHTVPDHCFYGTDGGWRYPPGPPACWSDSGPGGDWEGRRLYEPQLRYETLLQDWIEEGECGELCSAGPGDRIGLLLDLDEGSMTVYKNDERLGAMVSRGLSGEYCWAVSMPSVSDCACIEGADEPPSSAREVRERPGVHVEGEPSTTPAYHRAARALWYGQPSRPPPWVMAEVMAGIMGTHGVNQFPF